MSLYTTSDMKDFLLRCEKFFNVARHASKKLLVGYTRGQIGKESEFDDLIGFCEKGGENSLNRLTIDIAKYLEDDAFFVIDYDKESDTVVDMLASRNSELQDQLNQMTSARAFALGDVERKRTEIQKLKEMLFAREHFNKLQEEELSRIVKCLKENNLDLSSLNPKGD